MINSVHGSGKYMQVMGGSTSTYINAHSGLQNVGNVRFNTNAQRMEVYDGNNYVPINMSSVNIGLNHEAESLLDWARKKRDEEEKLKALMERHIGLKDLYDKFEIMRVLCQEEENKNEMV
jgi:hypothetical protein